jgi:hypothetical protein
MKYRIVRNENNEYKVQYKYHWYSVWYDYRRLPSKENRTPLDFYCPLVHYETLNEALDGLKEIQEYHERERKGNNWITVLIP